MEKIKIISIEQQNPYYDPARSCNGGGYDQPLIRFEFKGVEGYFSDSSCGEFGRRHYVKWKDAFYEADSVGNNYEFSSFDRKNPEHVEFVEAFNEQIENCVYYRRTRKRK